MAQVLPFEAVRPHKDQVSQVISQSYEQYNEEELTKILATNPYSFLQIITAGTTSKQSKMTTKQRFDQIKKTYQEFKQRHYFQKEQAPAYYIYRLQNDQGIFTGIIAKTSTQDYDNNRIKKHEEIISVRKKNFANYLQHVGFNADPVLLTYPDDITIENIIQQTITTNPAYDFSIKNEEHHQLWLINDSKTVTAIQNAFVAIPALYIADGHHRCASSSALAHMMEHKGKNRPKKDSYNYFMSFLLSESQLKIYEFNRLLTDLNGHTAAQLLDKIAWHYHIERFGVHEQIVITSNTQFYMYLEGVFYRLTLKQESYTFTDALSHLAPQLLNVTILQPILGVTDVRKDPRIQYTYAKDSQTVIKKMVDTNTYKIGFGMQAVTIQELKNIADAYLKMPPKSTYVIPKLPSGLLLYEF